MLDTQASRALIQIHVYRRYYGDSIDKPADNIVKVECCYILLQDFLPVILFVLLSVKLIDCLRHRLCVEMTTRMHIRNSL